MILLIFPGSPGFRAAPSQIRLELGWAAYTHRDLVKDNQDRRHLECAR